MRVAAFRLANWDAPLWAGPNRRSSRFVVDGRTVQYWALHPLTLWAEMLRFHGVTDPSEAQEWLLRPWVAELELPDGTLEIDFDTATAHGLEPDALIDDDHTRCQEWATDLDCPAIVVPSAALPGTKKRHPVRAPCPLPVRTGTDRRRPRCAVRPGRASVGRCRGSVGAHPVARDGARGVRGLAHRRRSGTSSSRHGLASALT